MIALLLTAAFAFIAGAVGGILVYRNNVARLQKTESEGKKLIDALKGR